MRSRPFRSVVFDVSETVRVDVPPSRVFEFLDDPNNHAAITPSLSDVSAVEPLSNGGKRLEYTYRLGGVPIEGTLVQTVHDPPTRHGFELRGTLSGDLSLAIEPEGDGCVVTYAASYDLPGGALLAVARPLVSWYNRREARRTLSNLRDSLAGEEGR